MIFEAGSVSLLNEELDLINAERVVIICGNHASELIEAIVNDLGSRVVKVISGSTMHVPIDLIETTITSVKDAGSDVILAVGGGSSIGLAKAIARRVKVPIVALPTTYSGSEMTPIWGETHDGVKTTGRDPFVRPITVVYDPELTLSLPLQSTVTSVFNALAHAVESMYSPDQTPISDLISREAIRLAVTALPKLVKDPLSLELRSSLLQSSWLCGTVLGTTTMALHHKICHVLGGAFRLPHAQTHTIILPYVLQFNAPAIPGVYKDLASIMNADDPANALWELGDSLGAPKSLVEIGMDIDWVPIAVEQLLTETGYYNPREVSGNELTAIILRAARGERFISTDF